MITMAGLRELPEKLAVFLERRASLIVWAVAAAGVSGMVARAAMTPLWFDELATLYLSRLPGVTEVWRALASGADANPPASYILIHAIRSAFGEGEIAMRLLSMVGLVALGAGVYLFTRKHSGTLSALVALLISAGTTAFAFSYSARPYAAVTGCLGAAMICWQRATEPGRRVAALMGLAAAMGMAVSLHYYAVFLMVPFLFAEGARWWSRKQPDFGVIGAVILPILLSSAYLPMAIAGARHLTGCGEWGGRRPAVLDVFPAAYAGLLPSAGLWIGLGAVTLGILGVLDRENAGAKCPRAAAGPPAHVWVFAIALAMLPFWVFFGTALVGLPSSYMMGYTTSAVAGIGLLAGFVAGRRPAAMLGAFLLLHFVAHQANAVRLCFRSAPSPDAPLLEVVRQHPGIPVVADWEALRLLHYGPRDVRERVIALREAELADNAQCMVTLAPYAPVPFQQYREVVAGHRKFLVWAKQPSRHLGALLRKFAADGIRADWLAQTADAQLYLVTGP